MTLRNANGMPLSYDAWRLSGPPEDEYETDEDREAGEDAEARAYDEAEERAMEAHFERKYGDGR